MPHFNLLCNPMKCNVMEHVRVDLAFADKLRLFLVSEKTGEREARVHL